MSVVTEKEEEAPTIIITTPCWLWAYPEIYFSKEQTLKYTHTLGWAFGTAIKMPLLMLPSYQRAWVQVTAILLGQAFC